MFDPINALNALLGEDGLFVRGGFHPTAADDVHLITGNPAKTVLLIGNAGNDLWKAFRRDVPQLEGANPLDTWLDSEGFIDAETLAPTTKGTGQEACPLMVLATELLEEVQGR